MHELNVTPFEGLALAACTDLTERGTISAKAKAPACDDAFGKAVAAPTDKRGFVMPEFLGHGVGRTRMVYGHGVDYPQGLPHGFTHVINRHAHLLRVMPQRVVLKSRKGATTMQVNPMGHLAPTSKAAPAITKTFALTEATTSINLAGFYVRRDNIAAARRKLRQALQALNALELAHV